MNKLLIDGRREEKLPRRTHPCGQLPRLYDLRTLQPDFLDQSGKNRPSKTRKNRY